MTEAEYTPFDRSQWIKTPARIRKEVNEYFKKAFGGLWKSLVHSGLALSMETPLKTGLSNGYRRRKSAS